MAQPPANQPRRYRVPAKTFSPVLAQGYRSDLVNANNYRIMAPISIGADGIPLTDILLHGANIIPGAGDNVMQNAPYGIIKFYFTVRLFLDINLFHVLLTLSNVT